MNPADQTRWSVVIPRDLDKDLRVYLAENGAKKGNLSKYIEEAVRWRLFSQTVTEARKGFEDMEPEAAQALIDEAVMAVRSAQPTPQPR
ncbi:MAG: ribbon-helix-helix domain-containing protein [Burkholderiaceae bacterium]|nr:ribbon-helix-helix domain-containing protein [Burkholderiaceae bacterium]